MEKGWCTEQGVLPHGKVRSITIAGGGCKGGVAGVVGEEVGTYAWRKINGEVASSWGAPLTKLVSGECIYRCR